MNVNEALSLDVDAAPNRETTVTLTGILVCTTQFSYVVSKPDDTVGVLLHAEPPSLTERLLQCAPPYGGSAVIYTDACEIAGVLCNCVLPMFPRLLHSITDFVFDGHRIVANGDGWAADPPFA